MLEFVWDWDSDGDPDAGDTGRQALVGTQQVKKAGQGQRHMVSQTGEQLQADPQVISVVHMP